MHATLPGQNPASRVQQPHPHLVLFFERHCKAVDDGAQDFQQLSDAVMALGFEDEAVEDVVDGLADEGPMYHELAVDAVQDGLEVVALARVLRVKQLQQLEDELLVDVLLGDLGIRVIGHDVAQQELVHNLHLGVHDVGRRAGMC
eukprot:1162049-Pelagomonas_calceolata.AAC.7